ncbi:hypothetical protein JAO29_15480 [Edaphobacter sp. HDX4]|uniref:hypothetical protein n=1 Tax=Edaphobacter sp. HDX4 TaxID=2794064 RepID=UPI002FE55686
MKPLYAMRASIFSTMQWIRVYVIKTSGIARHVFKEQVPGNISFINGWWHHG